MGDCICGARGIDLDVHECVTSLKRANEELEQLFQMRYEADMRAIQRWRKEDPIRRRLRQPDHADLVVFLVNELEKVAPAKEALTAES